MASRRSAVVGALIALLLGSATSVAHADTTGVATAAGTPAAVPALSWAACGTTANGTAAGVQCATADLPMDYDQPDGEQVHIAVARVPARDQAQRIGSLFFDFGGPGAPSIDYLQGQGAGIFGPLNARFDIVGFDPRGVGQSTPSIDCKINPGTQASPQQMPTPGGLDVDALVASAKSYVDTCLANNGAILEHISTANVARDMDALRAAVGDEKLSYLGFSYGTFLGATYAALFPDRYRALVLDGALDAEQYIHQPVDVTTAQAGGFEGALNRFMAACAADQKACSGFGGHDPLAAYDSLLKSAEKTPIQADAYTRDPRPVTAEDIREATAALLYAKQAWGLLAAALADAASGNGAIVRALIDQVVRPRRDDGSLDPFGDRFFAIAASEQEWPTDVDSYLRRGEHERADFPHFWSSFAYAEIPFALWPKHDGDAYGGPFTTGSSAPTTLVVGTTHDPATPYPGAVALVKQARNARLLTMDGDGHTAYGGNSSCIDSAVEAYLFDGALPAKGTVCKQEVPFVAPARAPVGAGTATDLPLPAEVAAVAARRP
jgi:pimeloyl-ACP methyl ester carboxylesterase